ncbi:MAG: TPM domain-containing protein [Bifidobacteriaceae bacterium]|nr:TPM domain-containing protein [Bifidobacteriaceae bacterium]
MRRQGPLAGMFVLVTGLALVIGGVLGAAPAAAANDLPLLVDGADLLTSSEERALAERLDAVSAERGADVVIVTVQSLGARTSTEFADDYFDYGPSATDPLVPGEDPNAGYGQGYDRSGILFLISLEARDWAISTRGGSISVFSDRLQADIMDEVRPYLSDGQWAAAFNEFVGRADRVYATDGRSASGGSINWPALALITLIAGVIGGFLPVTAWKAKLKSVRPAADAARYLATSEVSLTHSRDDFINQHTVVTDISASYGVGGGSSTHVGSSGATHGGSSGKF